MNRIGLLRISLSTFISLCALGAALFALGQPAAQARALAATTRTYPSGDCPTTLQACISASADGDTVLVSPGTYVTATLNITRAVNLIGAGADPAAVRLHPTSGRMIQYSAPTISATTVISNLTVENGNVAGSSSSGGGIRVVSGSGVPLFHSIVVSNNIAVGGGGIRILPALPVTMVNVVVFSNTSTTLGGGISVAGDLTLIDSHVEQNSAGSNGGGAHVAGTLTLINTALVSNTAASGGGAFAVDATLAGGSFERNAVNTFKGLGGGLLVNGSLHVSGTHFLSNTAFLGGGLYVTNSVAMTSALFMTNSAVSGGGAYVSNTMSMSNAQFISNTAKARGGGARVIGNATLSGGRFENNYAAANSGGGLRVDTDLTATNTVFLGNITDNLGGGAFVDGDARLDGGRFENNLSTGKGSGFGNGGGLQVNGSLTLTGTEFLRNRAFFAGGAVVLRGVATLNGGRFDGNVANNCAGLSAATVRASNTQFVDNTAQSSGGGACGPGSFSGVRFENNRAINALGGGLAINAGNTVISNSQFISNSAATGGGINVGDFLASHVDVVNTLFARNHAATGAAVALSGGVFSQTVNIVHATVADRSLNPSQAIAVFTGTLGVTDTIIVNHAIGISRTASTVVEDYNLFFGNTTNTTGGGFSGGHSIGGDPAFVNAAGDDYHLGLASAAIDAGVNAGVFSDFDGNPRPIGAGFDIGTDEFAGVVRHVFLPLVVR